MTTVCSQQKGSSMSLTLARMRSWTRLGMLAMAAGLLLLTACSGGEGGVAAAAPPTGNQPSGIIGAWEVTTTVGDMPSRRLTLAFTEGIMIVQPASGEMTGLGTWSETSDNTIETVFVHYNHDEHGIVVSKVTIRQTLEVSGDSYSGTAEATVTALDGSVIATLPAVTEGTRLRR